VGVDLTIPVGGFMAAEVDSMVVVGAAVAEGDTGADTEDNHVGVWEAIIPSPAPERPMT
jgi:hypothetical protein